MPAQFSNRSVGRRNPRRKPTTVSNEVQYDTNMIASFKMAPSFKAEEFMVKRPFMGQCCRCMPVSREDFSEPTIAESGMRNILDVKPELGVVEAIQRTAKDLDAQDPGTDNLALVEKRASRIIRKMKASISTVFIKFTGWFLLKFLSLMLRSVVVHKGQVAVLKKAAERRMPMIYLPLHRSHLDYVLITFLLWNFDIRAPHVAAGENMDIPFFSLLMRSLGGFFIRRRLDNGGNQKDVLYRAILHTYILELLKKGESLEVFIEGGRTRTGRAIIPKGGLLSIVVEACAEGIIPDAYIVPMSISYDKLLEGNFCTEQMGGRKKAESFGGAMRSILRVIFGDFGSVRVDFAQPFSLHEFLKSCDTYPTPDLSYISAHGGSDSFMSSMNLSQSGGSLSSLFTEGQDGNRMLVRALAEHTVHTCTKTQAPMCSNILAFLLLTKFRQGATLPYIAVSVEWLKEQLKIHGQDVGFCGKPEDVIVYAQGLLGENLVARSLTDDQDLFLTPNLALPAVFELSYYASSITNIFVLESIMVSAVVLEAGLSPSTWTPKQQIDQTPSVRRDVVMETARHICDLLHAEFILVPPCMRLADALVDKVEDFISMEILFMEESEYDRTTDLAERQWVERLSKSLAYDEEDEEEGMGGRYVERMLRVNVGLVDVREKIQFLHALLAPVLESYLITACYIAETLTVEMPEDDFMKKLGMFAQERARNKLVMYTESCAVLTLKNAVSAFKNLKIMETYKGANLTMVGLNEHFGVRERLERYIEILKVARC
ncbi:hypothetical protein BaRGS_00025529 [Batillaria attramentaria]|uniref:Phospholipid/glycerol acyltransferase domain-containing protein n=1 Tax=Batillaria attramentaria TaxID=370345 RepID=A0ABD0K832_9CAEN